MKKLILLLTLLYQFWHLTGQNSLPILERKITIKSTNQPLEKVLNIISETAGFNFSYGDQININQRVTVHAENRTVKEVLDQIFKNEISYQQIGNHLILQKKIISKPSSQIPQKDNKPIKYKYTIKGYVRDLNTGNGLANVSIYHKQTLANALSGDFGYYEINITSKEQSIGVNYSITGYTDTALSIDYINNGLSEINLNLKKNEPPSSENNSEAIITDSNGIELKLQDSVKIAKKDTFNSKLAWEQSSFRQIKVSETQIGKWFINKYQRLSETNIQDSFYRVWQFTLFPPAGTNGRLSGLVTNQFSFNLLAGYNGGLDGVEFGGLLNIIKKDVYGAQFSGFGNIVGGNTDGAQFAGFFNHNLGNLYGAQVAGFININHDFVFGIQGAGFLNINGGYLQGVQGAGFMNINGGQIDGFQGAGFMNMCGSKIRGTQIAGFMNIAKHVEGCQIAGFLNIAGKIRGSQIGIINIADSLEGAAIGIINFIGNGLHQLEISRNECNYGLAYRSGTNKLYSTIFITSELPVIDSNTLMSYGWGLGTSFKLAKSLRLTLDGTAQQLTFNFNSDHLNLQSKLSLNLELKLFKGFALFGGASLNHLLADPNDPHFESTFADYGTKSIYNYRGTYDQHMWLGYQFGLRLF